MARMLDSWETEMEREKRKKAEENKKRSAFVKKWISSSEEQKARIVFDILNKLEEIQETVRSSRDLLIG